MTIILKRWRAITKMILFSYLDNIFSGWHPFAALSNCTLGGRFVMPYITYYYYKYYITGNLISKSGQARNPSLPCPAMHYITYYYYTHYITDHLIGKSGQARIPLWRRPTAPSAAASPGSVRARPLVIIILLLVVVVVAVVT